MSIEAHFIILQRGGNPKKFSISRGQSIIIGRSEQQANIIVEDDLCSSTHCKLTFEPTQIIIEDLESKNGLYCRDKKITQHKVELHDKIKMGQSTLYLNPKLMESDIKAKPLIQNKGYVGDDESISLSGRSGTGHYSYSGYTRTMMSKKNLEKNRKRLSTKPKSSVVLNLLNSLAQIIDIIISIIFFIFIIHMVVRSYPELLKLSYTHNFIKFILLPEMYFYSGACLLCSAIFYKVIRSIPGGSIGERILRVNQ